MDEIKNIPRGRPKSGRTWKSQKTRFSDKTIDKCLRTSWDIKMKIKAEKKAIKTYEKELKEERNRKLEEKRKRTEAKKKKILENSRKNEIVQPIKDTAKIKKMKRKQLRYIEKR